MTYTVTFSSKAQKHIEAWERSGNQVLLRKIVALKARILATDDTDKTRIENKISVNIRVIRGKKWETISCSFQHIFNHFFNTGVTQ